MEIGSSVRDIIDDLREFGRGEWEPEAIPIEIVRYLLLNYFPIKTCVDLVYTHFSQEERIKLSLEHRELDHSVTNNNFHFIALAALDKLQWYYMLPNRITKDNLDMLIRALEYGKYINFDVPNLFRDP